MAKPLERVAEDKFVKWCEGNGWECLKLRIDGVNGFPDRTVIADGFTIYVEFKRPGESLRPAQEEWRDRLLELGHHWTVAESLEEAIEFTEDVIYERLRNRRHRI